jgi:hypothetical protein
MTAMNSSSPLGLDQQAQTVPLRCLSGARADVVSLGVSDRLGEFGERGRDS